VVSGWTLINRLRNAGMWVSEDGGRTTDDGRTRAEGLCGAAALGWARGGEDMGSDFG
jgi:hypothetical protein